MSSPPLRSSIFLGHLGLGDQFTANAIVRYLLTRYDRVVIVIRKSEATMRQMYADVPERVQLLRVQSDTDISPRFGGMPALLRLRAEMRKHGSCDAVLIGNHQPFQLFGLPSALGVAPSDYFRALDPRVFYRAFYRSVGLGDYERDRWQYQAAAPRLIEERERPFRERVLDAVGRPQEYAFVHQDQSRGVVFLKDGANDTDGRKEKARLAHVDCNGETLQRAGLVSENLWDYGLLIEGASELHMLDSAFCCLLLFLRWQQPEHVRWRRIVLHQRGGAWYELRDYFPRRFFELYPFVEIIPFQAAASD